MGICTFYVNISFKINVYYYSSECQLLSDLGHCNEPGSTGSVTVKSRNLTSQPMNFKKSLSADKVTSIRTCYSLIGAPGGKILSIDLLIR